MLHEDLITSLCAFADNSGYSHLHGNFVAIDHEGNHAGEIDAVFSHNGRYCISHMNDAENTLRIHFCDGSVGAQLAYMGPNTSADQRGSVVAAIIDRVLG